MSHTREDLEAQRASALRLINQIEAECRAMRDILGRADHLRVVAGHAWYLTRLEEAHDSIIRAGQEATRVAVPRYVTT